MTTRKQMETSIDDKILVASSLKRDLLIMISMFKGGL